MLGLALVLAGLALIGWWLGAASVPPTPPGPLGF